MYFGAQSLTLVSYFKSELLTQVQLDPEVSSVGQNYVLITNVLVLIPVSAIHFGGVGLYDPSGSLPAQTIL